MKYGSFDTQLSFQEQTGDENDEAVLTPSAVERVDALYALAVEIREREPQRALSLAQDAARLSHAASYARGVAQATEMIGNCHSLMSEYEPAQRHLEEALTLSRAVEDARLEGNCLHTLGIVHLRRSDYPTALQYILQAIALRQGEGAEGSLGKSLNAAGVIFFSLGDYPTALRYYCEARQIQEALGDAACIASLFTNMGNVSMEMGDYERALEYHQECVRYARQCGRTISEVSGLCNSSEALNFLGRYEDALQASQSALPLARQITFRYAEIGILLSMARSYRELRQINLAEAKYEEGLLLARAVGSKEYECQVLLDLGRLRSQSGDLPPARAYLTDAATIASGTQLRLLLAQTHQALSDLSEREGDSAGALEHHRTFYAIEKEIFNQNADRRTKGLMIQMEVEKAQKEAELHRRQNAELARANAALAEANRRLETLATTDPLTDLPNHRAMIAVLDAAIETAVADTGSCAVLFLDVDHFKTINDTYGHAAGDAALRAFAARVKGCLRGGDALGRWGGEEFVALLPHTDEAEALATAERLRGIVAGQTFDGAGTCVGGLRLTCSIGVACCPRAGTERRTLVHAADEAMYAAKRLGRNQVRAAGEPAIVALRNRDVTRRA